jgi:hypothetical protein
MMASLNLMRCGVFSQCKSAYYDINLSITSVCAGVQANWLHLGQLALSLRCWQKLEGMQ